MARTLTKKQRIFLKEVQSGKSALEAAKIAYNVSTPGSASAMATYTMKRVRTIMEEEYEKVGLTKEFLAKALKEDIESKKGKPRTKEIELAARMIGAINENKKVESMKASGGIEDYLQELNGQKAINGEVI